ncbi:MAG TPA: hypothetical protein VKY92_10475 [Verrucomicrobiae bacterium]|nr:hypothetical protein [Verrucomicrobiae bacterium]
MAKSKRKLKPSLREILRFAPVLAVTVGAFTDRATSADSANLALEEFKNFISHPPVISNLVFQQKVPMGGGARPLDGSFAHSTSFEYFQARWQTNGLLFRKLTAPSDVTNLAVAGELVSWSGHEHALLERGERFTTWDDRDPTVAGKTVSIFYTSEWLQDPLRQVLNLGIMFVGIGSVRWDGNRFHVESKVDGQRLLVSGEVMPGVDGPPREMTVCYALPHRTNYYALRYGYGPARSYSMPPTVITNFWIRKDLGKEKAAEAELDLDEWRILDFQSANNPLAQEVFAAAEFARQNGWQGHIYTNNAIYDRTTNGVLQLAYSFTTAPNLSNKPTRTLRTVFYGAWGGMNIAIIALMARAKEAKKQQTKNERKSAL